MNKDKYKLIENYMNTCMEDSAHDNQHIYRVLYNDTRPSFFQEYKYKLEGLYSNFYTAEAELIAKERQAAAVAFYNSLYEEARSSYENGKEELGKILE